jgi:hypothetical protein
MKLYEMNIMTIMTVMKQNQDYTSLEGKQNYNEGLFSDTPNWTSRRISSIKYYERSRYYQQLKSTVKATILFSVQRLSTNYKIFKFANVFCSYRSH